VQPSAAGFIGSELRLPARSSELGAARKYAGEAAAAFGLDSERSHDFVYAVNEAVTNAIRHGAPDAQGLIHLSVAADADRLTLTVRDYGTFVIPTSLPTTTFAHGGHGLAERGLGLGLMARFTDELRLSIRPGSTTVSLSKKGRTT
jgi:anti-sigma regulatory factor (Ser/Thr protein kinase)